MKKVTGRLEFLKTEFGFVFPEEETEQLLKLDNPGIGNLMVKYGYAQNKNEAEAPRPYMAASRPVCLNSGR